MGFQLGLFSANTESGLAITTAPAGKPLTITADVRAPAGVKWVRLRYRGVNQQLDYQTLPLEPGDTLVFYTDGVTEAFNPQKVMFGDGRLIEHLRHQPGARAADTVASVLGAVRQYAGDHPQSDDIAIVAVRYG